MSDFHFNFLPGDMVGIKDDGYIEIPEGYFYSGMILREKAPIHTFTYYVMLYPKNTIMDNQIKIIEVPEEHLIMDRYINRDHYDFGTSKDHSIHILFNLLKTIRKIKTSSEETENLLAFLDGYIDAQIDLEKMNLYGKSHLSSTYGEVLNNGKIK